MIKPTIGQTPWGETLNTALDDLGVVAAPGNDGDLKATVGGAITNVKPGRIDARVRGAVGDNSTVNTTIINALIVESATTGAELHIPDGTYVADATTTGNLKITGSGTIKSNTTHALAFATTSGPLHIEGLGFDGNGVYSGMRASGSVNGLTVKNCRFANTGAGRALLFASISGLVQNVLIDGNHFAATCGGGIYIGNAAATQIINNRCDGTTSVGSGDFIKLVYYADSSPAGSGEGVIISGNIGRNIERMGIELWSASANAFTIYGVAVTDNWIEVNSNMGMSLASCDFGHVSNNTLIQGGTGSYGIEIVQGTVSVIGNTVRGPFVYGIGIQDAARSLLQDNHIDGVTNGIYTTLNTFRNNNSSLVISRNHIRNAELYGIYLGNIAGGATGPWGGDLVEGNVIWRDVLATDAGVNYRAIRSSVPRRGPNIYRNNIMVQAAAVPTLNSCQFMQFTGTNTKKSRIEGNQFIDLATMPFAQGINGASGTVSYQGMIVRNNHFQNLASLSSHEFVTSVQASGNSNTDSTRSNNDRQIYGLSIPPSDYTSQEADTPTNVSIRGHNSAAPALNSGYYHVGDLVLNNTPTAGGFVGWVCITAGNPGTWKTFGVISA